MKRFDMKMLRGREGNVALVTALMAPIVVLLAGGAVDLTNASMRQSQLQAAADAAAISSVARASPAYNDALGMTSDGVITDPKVTQQAQAVFNADMLNAHLSGTTLSIQTQKTGTTVSTVATASSTFSPAFLGLIGRQSIALAVTSHASDNIPAYMNFYMLLDNTPSMGLGATATDVNAMVSATGCAFACHATGGSENYYAVAKALGVTMRIDVVRQATQQLTQTANNTQNTNGIANEFQMAVYDFGTAAYVTPALNQVSPLSAALTSTVYNNANAVDLETVPSNNYAYTSPGPSGSISNNDEDTSFDYTMTQLGNIMVPPSSTAGNGSTAAAPVPILFMVTDGMVDQNSGGRQMGGINAATCTALKNKGIKIAILYTTYSAQSIQADSWSNSNVVPLLPQVAPALQACASPNLYYPVSPTDGIPEAMAALFQKVVATVKITG